VSDVNQRADWLWTEGHRLVVERYALHPQRVAILLHRWLDAVGGDARALANVIRSAAAVPDDDPKLFESRIADGIKQHSAPTPQLSLRLFSAIATTSHNEARQSPHKPKAKTRGASSANVTSFPLARRQDLIRRIARLSRASSPAASENLLQGQLARQARGLRRRRLPSEIVAREISELESLVRAEMGIRHPDRANG
jgi:hypothetical protein